MRKGLLFLLMSAGAVFSQDARVGLGVGWDKSLFIVEDGSGSAAAAAYELVPVGFTMFSVPILIGGTAKVEPEIGFYRNAVSREGEGGLPDSEFSSSFWQMALGISGGKRVDNLLYQFGVRGGFTRQAAKSEQGETEFKSSRMNFHVGPTAGAEYFFHPGMSVGAQIGLSYVFIGQPDTEESDPDFPGVEDDAEVSEYLLGNSARISLRWYY